MPSALRSVPASAWWMVGVLLILPLAHGQASYPAQGRGIVSDQTGAMVQGALVTITNDGTGIATNTHTDDHGLYTFTGLRPATYTIKCEAKGFQTVERKQVVLQVDQQTSIDFTLKPPGVLATVEVTAATPPLDTESAAIGTDITNEYVLNIPLYNRSLFGLAFLAGGVTETTGSGINDNYPSGTNFVSNGQRNATAQVSLDGSPLSAPEQGEGGNSNVYYQPSVEIVQEFKVQNNSFSSEFGNNGGTVVNIVLKQGTNQFHGSGWWYGQRSEFHSRDYFNTGAKPDHIRDQYGFAIGGPVKKNRTFFFFDFEKVRQQDPVNIEGVVPTDLERAGDFSQSPANLPDPNNPVDTAAAGIYDPCAGNTDPTFVCPRNQFSDGGILNKIPASKIDPIGQNLINLYPHANVAGAVFPNPNFRKVTLDTHPGWQFDLKLDHQISDKHKISGRYSRHHDQESVPTIVGSTDFNDGILYTTDVHNGSLEYNWALKPTALWASRVGVGRVSARGQSNHYPTLSDVRLPSILDQNGLDRVPYLNVGSGFLSMFSQCCVDTRF